MFVAVDGIDGAGKSTLVAALGGALAHLRPLLTREPTRDSVWGQAIRRSLTHGRMPRAQEIEHFHQDRIWHCRMVIAPALAEGRLVICDRYVDSTLAFQAEGPEDAAALYQRMAPDIIEPDLTLILDCPVNLGLSRIQGRGEGRTSFETIGALEHAADIYRSRVGRSHVHIDATQQADAVLKQALAAIETRRITPPDRPVPVGG